MTGVQDEWTRETKGGILEDEGNDIGRVWRWWTGRGDLSGNFLGWRGDGVVLLDFLWGNTMKLLLEGINANLRPHLELGNGNMRWPNKYFAGDYC